MKAEMIKTLEAKGFKRWTKGNMDRLYINADQLGLEVEFYKTGNVSSAYLNGEKISNSRGAAMKSAKCYIDIETGKCVSSYDAFVEAMEAIVADVETQTEESELIEEAKENEEGKSMKKYYFINDIDDCDSWFGDQYPTCCDEETICQITDDEWSDSWHEANEDEINRYGVFDDDVYLWGTLPARVYIDGNIIDADSSMTPDQITDAHGNKGDIIIWMHGETNKPSTHRFTYNNGHYEQKPSGELLVLVEEIQDDELWCFAKLARLCEFAGMSAEWENSDHETFKQVALAAAEKLGVEIQ